MGRERILSRMFTDNALNVYDFVLIDCLPALNMLTVNALAASTGAIVPVQTQDFALNGIAQFEDTFGQVHDYINSELELVGILPTMLEHTNTTKSVLEKLDERYEGSVFNTTIEKLAEAPDSVRFKRSLVNSRNSRLGAKYMELAQEVIERISE